MSELKEVDGRKVGRYLLNSDCSGRIDAEELANACRRLGISGPLEPLLRELKIKDENSVTSATPTAAAAAAKDSPRKTSQKREKRLSCSKTRESPDYSLEQFDIKGGNSYSKESWGRDSGARDLSPEPNSHRLHELNVESQLMDTEAGGTSAMLHLASKLQVAALSALETEVLELSTRLQKSEQERDSIQKKLNEALDEKERSQRRLESIGAAHESRITEMHCVIVELSKKLKNQQENAILEEHEPDGSGSVSELSFQEGSVYNSEMECTNFEQQSQTEPLDVKLAQPDQKSESHYSLPQLTSNVGGQMQIQAMQEEILYLRSHMALLQSKLASAQDKIYTDGPNGKLDSIENVRLSPKARSNTSDDLCETADIFDASHLDETMPKVVKANKNFSSLSGQRMGETVMAKSNERGKSRRVGSEEHQQHIPNEMEHIVASVGLDERTALEMQRLQRSIDHLRVQNNVLSINLGESKAHSEHLYLLCGKYESNAIALNAALNCSDRTIEAYDVMLALLESKLAILENSESAMESRKAAESVAKHLMMRLESDKNTQGNSLGPWQDTTVMYSGSTSSAIPWTDDDDQKLREQMSKLKGQRTVIQNTVVTLESPYKDYEMNVNSTSVHSNTKVMDTIQPDSQKLDLETAVLTQELMSLREDYNEMKIRIEQADCEKRSALERLTVMQNALLHLQAQLADSEALLAISKKERTTSYSDAEHSAGIELELVEALARESRLKARLQALAGSLETATKSSEEKYAQVQSTVAELKQANLSLTQSLDRCKRKYQARLKRMEQQLLEMTLKQGNENAGGKSAVPETTL